MDNVKFTNQPNYNTYENLINYFSPKIRNSLKNVPLQEQDDLKQEIHIKIFEKFNLIQDLEAPGFFEFLNRSLIEDENNRKTNI